MSRPSLPATTTTSRGNPNQQQQQPMNHNVDTSMGLLNSNHMIHLMSSSSSGTISNSSSTTHQVFKQGYLSKKPLKAISSKSNFKYRFKGWKKRWFVLSRTSLYYYKDAAAAAAAQIQMQNLKNVVKTSNTSFHDSSSSQFGQLSDKYQPLGIISLVEDIKIEKDDLESTESGMFVFKIRTPYAVHLLAASTDLERKEWIDCIVGISGAIQMSKLVQYVTKLQVTIIEAKLNDELVQELNLSNHQESRSNNNHELVPAQNSNNQMLKQHSKNTSSTDNNNNDNKNNKNNKNNDKNNKNNNVNTLNSTTRKSDVIENSQYQVSCKVKSNFQEFSTIAQSKTITPIWNETFVLDMPRFPMEIFLILELTETKETKVTNLLSHQQQQKKLTQFTQYSRNGLVKMTILEPDLVESVQAQQQESNDLVNLSYFQLTNQNASAAKSSFEVSFEKWFNAILEQDDGNDFIAKKKSQFVVDEDEDEDGEDGNNHGNEKHHHHNLMNELYEPAMTQLKRKKRNLGKIYARVEYIFEDMQGFPLSYQSIQNQIREAIRMQNELMNKILNGSQTRKENTSQKKLLGLYQDHFVEDEEEEELKNKSKQNNKNSNTTTTTTPSNAPSSVDSLLNEQKKKHRRQLITRRYKQELDRVMSDRNAELLKRAQESQKTTLEMLQESIQDRKRQYENIENEYQRKEFEQQKKLQLKLKREEEQRLKEINKTLKQKEYEKKRQLSIQTNREKLLDERNRIIEILKFKAEKSKHFEKLHNAIKQEEERATQELASTIEKKEREFKLKAQRRIEENEEQMLRELDEKIKREEEFKAKN
ncbi:hypothetical protein C9374_007726 [Naegleria lovaniensis]|uniref:PH domain-containing protein n=1 Tax=Naegleria lovaniensis TaxID=51637 RepID=A0AA88GMN7_NAELO|nr:uncharacterized protein C9374_007726 [Naegleria lovaniensis]KAG2379088.1 hypothetical protein C9374_007726 [Naegleria lovaniensis]